jgi:hypothetical protein
MKTTLYFIQSALVYACLAVPLQALEQRSDVQIRIHSPFADLYAGENDSWLVRVENRGKETIPVPDQGWSGQGEFTPTQFHVQTEAEVDAGKRPTASEWEEIESFGYGRKDLIVKSLLGSGQAMEAFSWGLPGQLKTPPQGGKFRVAMQVGPDDFVYSNWITRTRHEKPVPGMRTIHVGDPRGDGSECQIGISEGTRPRYLWYFPSGSVDSQRYRICEVPEGMLPNVQIDQERGQYVFSFPPGGPATTYFAYRCGLSKSTPWPKGYLGKDYLLTAYPASDPSPIGFPMELFREGAPSGSEQQKSSPIVTEPSERHVSEHNAPKAEKSGVADWSSLWVFLMIALSLIGLVFYLIRRKKQIE